MCGRVRAQWERDKASCKNYFASMRLTQHSIQRQIVLKETTITPSVSRQSARKTLGPDIATQAKNLKGSLSLPAGDRAEVEVGFSPEKY